MGIFDIGDKRPRRARMGLKVAKKKSSYCNAITGLVLTACKIRVYMYRVMMIILLEKILCNFVYYRVYHYLSTTLFIIVVVNVTISAMSLVCNLLPFQVIASSI